MLHRLTFLRFLLHVIVCIGSQKYETDSVSFWRSSSYFKPILAKSYGKIQLRKEMEMKFKMICHSVRHDHPDNDYENILRIGQNGFDYGCGCHGSRYPAVYIDTKLLKFEFGISDSSLCWRQYPSASPCPECLSVNIGSTYDFHIKFNETNVYIEYHEYDADGQQLMDQGVIYDGQRHGVTNSNHLCRYQDIIISDPLNIAADVTLWDIEIRSIDIDSYCEQWEKYQRMHQEL